MHIKSDSAGSAAAHGELPAAWPEALAAAWDEAGRAPEDPALLWFLEDREDAFVESDGLGAPRCGSSRTSGLAVTSRGRPRRECFAADPRVEDVAVLARAAAAGGRLDLTSMRDGEMLGRPRALPLAPAEALAERVADAVRVRLPTADLRVRWSAFDQRVRVRDGMLDVEDRRSSARLRVEASLSADPGPVRAVAEATLTSTWAGDLGATLDACLGLVDEVAARAERRVVAVQPTAGPCPVVFAAGVGGVLVHEIVGHALESDVLLDGASWLAERRLGETVGNEVLTVIDDPRRARAPWRFDDEGEPARPVALIRDGRLAGRLHDRETARGYDEPANGHGRRAAFRAGVRPRMGCTFVAPGRCSVEEVLDGVENGVHVRRMEVASTDPLSGRAVFLVSDADRVRNGRLGDALLPFLLLVDASRALTGIDRVARDLKFDPCVGSCVRHGQPLSTSVGAPTLRLGLATVVAGSSLKKRNFDRPLAQPEGGLEGRPSGQS